MAQHDFPSFLKIDAIECEQYQDEKRLPVTIGLCLDHSSSMDGQPLELVKQSVELVLQQLQSNDRIGLVRFSNQATTLAEPVAFSNQHRKYLEKALKLLEAEGATAMFDGLKTALQNMPTLRADQREMSIGRGGANDIVLPKGNVGKRHAKIVPTAGGYMLADLKSTNGMFLNGQKFSGSTPLKEGDQIYIGDFCLLFHEAPTELA